jgi:hypothetical protein
MAESGWPNAADLIAVRSRVSWGAIAAGAMVALTIYVVLTILGVALGIELAVRGTRTELGAGTAIYSIITLLLAMFFGGWATSRLAVGESKAEAVLYGLILWGVLFSGMIWLLASGIRTGFGGMVGLASGAYTNDEGQIDVDHVARDLKRAGFDDAMVNKYRDSYERLRADPGAAGEVGRELSAESGTRAAARQASWWSLVGVLISLATVVIGSLVGSGELLQPVPILGVRRAPGDRRPRTA